MVTLDPFSVNFDFYDLVTTLLGVHTAYFHQDLTFGLLVYSAGLFFIVYVLIYIIHVFTRLLMSVLTAGRYRE